MWLKGKTMKKISWGAFFLVVLGTAIALAPYFLFPVCQASVPTASGGAVPMKCFWTARAALGDGGVIVFSGLLLFFVKAPGVRLGIALAPLLAGALVAATPQWLIGVCPGEMMACRMGTLPALTLLGGGAVITAVCVAAGAGKSMTNSAQSASLQAEARFRAGKDRGAGERA
jgi:hypothetical protein